MEKMRTELNKINPEKLIDTLMKENFQLKQRLNHKISSLKLSSPENSSSSNNNHHHPTPPSKKPSTNITTNNFYTNSPLKKNPDLNLNIKITDPLEQIKQRTMSPVEKKLREPLSNDLEFLINDYMRKFYETTYKKSKLDLQKSLDQNKKEYKMQAKLILRKADDELSLHKQNLENIKLRNIELKENIKSFSDQLHHLQIQLKDAESSVIKIKDKYKVFNRLKKYYDELLFEFNVTEDDVKTQNKKISQDMKNRRKEANDCKEQIIQKREQIKNLLEKKHQTDLENRQKNEQISNDLFDLEIKNRSVEDEYNKKVDQLKQNIDYQSYLKEENIKIRNEFVTIFNIFYPTLFLEKDIIKNPKGIDLQKIDYSPKTYDMDEVVKYIYLMLKNSTEHTSGLLLREVVSYASMMLRNYVPSFDQTKYEPVSTTIEIEKLINEVVKENKELKNVINVTKKENEKDEKDIQDLELKIKRVEKMQELTHNQMKSLIYDKDKNFIDNKNKNKALYNNLILQKSKNKNYIINKSVDNKNFAKNKNKQNFDDYDSDDNNNKNKNKYLNYSDIEEEEEYLKKQRELKIKEEQKKKDISAFEQTVRGLIDHANRLFFYQAHLNNKPKEMGVYKNAHKRIQDKINRLKKIEGKSNLFCSVEKFAVNNVYKHLDGLVKTIKDEGQ